MLSGVYGDDRLVGVYLHTSGVETYTRKDALADLETGDLPRTVASTCCCPDCHYPLVNSHGLYARPACERIGVVDAEPADDTDESVDEMVEHH